MDIRGIMEVMMEANSKRELVLKVRKLLEHFDIGEGEWPSLLAKTLDGTRIVVLTDAELAKILYELDEMVRR